MFCYGEFVYQFSVIANPCKKVGCPPEADQPLAESHLTVRLLRRPTYGGAPRNDSFPLMTPRDDEFNFQKSFS